MLLFIYLFPHTELLPFCPLRCLHFTQVLMLATSFVQPSKTHHPTKNAKCLVELRLFGSNIPKPEMNFSLNIKVSTPTTLAWEFGVLEL